MTKCERCQKNPASIQIVKQIDGGEPTKHALCEECARELGLKPDGSEFSIGNLLAAFANLELAGEDREEADEVTCSCGHTYGQFGATGRLGCARCYITFRDRLEGLLRKVHGHPRHEGKTPVRSRPEVARSRARQELEARLENAVRREAYEEAARLRDQLRELAKQEDRREDADA